MTNRIAYLISVYKDPVHLQRLVSALSYGVEEYVSFFVHVDAKVDERIFRQTCKKTNVFFTPNRFWVQWGGYSQVKYQKELLRCAFETEKEQEHFSHFVIITGQDYPILSNLQMFDWYNKHPGQQILSGVNLTQNFSEDYHLFTMYHFFRDTHFERYLYQRIASAVSRKLMRLVPLRKHPYLQIDGKKWDVLKSSYMSLTHDCARYILEMMGRKDICDYFLHSFVPEEMMIPTIVFNSKWKSEAIEVQRSEYHSLISVSMLEEFEYGQEIKVYDEDDLEYLLSCGKFFCRKVQTRFSNKLMDMLDEIHLCSVK